MKEYRLRSYSYICSCGYRLGVFIDSGQPQDSVKCRKCGSSISRGVES